MPRVTVSDETVDRQIKTLRYFLGQARIDEARRDLAALLTPVNRFRELLMLENQPYLSALQHVSKVTLNGMRELRIRDCGPPEWRAAEAGGLLGLVERDLTPDLRQQMASRMLNFNHRPAALILELRTAAAYKALGFQVRWNPVGQPGPEFVCRRSGHEFGVECKRVTRMAKEMLSNRTACTLQFALACAADAKRLGGHILWETPLTNAILDSQALVARLSALLPDSSTEHWTATDETVGKLSGSWYTLPMHRPVDGWRTWLDQQKAAKPADCRFAGATLPLDRQPCGALSLWLRGPRRTEAEHAAWLTKQVMGAAEQLRDAPVGLIFVEVEGVVDVNVFSESGFFDDLGSEVFAAYPQVAAICWIGDAFDEDTDPGIRERGRRHCAQWNGGFPREQRNRIPLPGINCEA